MYSIRSLPPVPRCYRFFTAATRASHVTFAFPGCPGPPTGHAYNFWPNKRCIRVTVARQFITTSGGTPKKPQQTEPHQHHPAAGWSHVAADNDFQMGENTREEVPFPLTEVDKWVLSQTDEEFKYHTWDELRHLIGTDSSATPALNNQTPSFHALPPRAPEEEH